MREIKFRAWNKENSIMYNVVTDIHWLISGEYVRCRWCTSEEDYAFLINDGHCVGGKDRFILMQYTGLKDLNGKEAYWGDIVDDGINPLFAITSDYHLLARLSEVGFRVIGNICENKRLLSTK